MAADVMVMRLVCGLVLLAMALLLLPVAHRWPWPVNLVAHLVGAGICILALGNCYYPLRLL